MVDVSSYFIVTIICLQTLFNCALSIVGQYIYRFFLQTYSDHNSRNWTNISTFVINTYESAQETCTANTTDVFNDSAQIWAQQRSADLIFQATLWKAVPLIIVTYLYGLYASRLNRRLILLLSLFGNTIHVIIFQAIIYKHLAEYWWYISFFIAGLAGGANVLGIVFNMIITESTGENERSSRFVRLGALATALSALVIFGIGYYIEWRGFTDVFWMAIGFEILSILVIMFFLKSTYSSTTVNETTSLLSSTNVHVEIKTSAISHCFDICTIFSFNQRSHNKSVCLILIIVCYVFYLLVISALSPLLWYFLSPPFCWTSSDLGNFTAVSLTMTAIFSVLGMKVLSFFGADDAIICAVGHICYFGYILWIAFAKYSWHLYLALLIHPFSVYQNVLTFSMISKLFEVHERNTVFTLVTEINTIIISFGSSFFNWIYARTVIHHKNFTLLLAAGLCIIPFILNIYLYKISRRLSDEEQPIVQSEIDEEVTTLSLSNNILSEDVDMACLVLPSLSFTQSLSMSQNEKVASDNFHSSINYQNDQYTII